MKIYDQLINETKELLVGYSQIFWEYREGNAWEENDTSELILARDTSYELGGHGKCAVGLSCVTSDDSLVEDDKIVLIGPDINLINSDTSFARIALVKTKKLSDDDDEVYKAIREIDFVKYHVFPKGYMMRVSTDDLREQVRLSKLAVNKGISFRNIGNNFIRKYKENPNIEKVCIIFITDPNFDYKTLTSNANKAEKITKALNHFLEGLPTDCASCNLKPICDEVEGMRALHFKKNN